MKYRYYYILLVMLLGFVSCNSEVDTLPDDCNPIPLRGIRADIDNGSSTRAVAPLVDSIGKYSFLNTDEIVFTKIERTKRPIPGFSYKGVRYSCAVEGTGNSQNVSWKRNNPQEDIFWSDGSEPHTFIGYILPHEDDKTATASGYDWNNIVGQEVYYGSIGDPTNANEVIDYTATPANEAGENKPYDLEKLRKEDLLLTYDVNMQNEDAMAQVHFHHGLASIRVVVTITGFSSTGMDPDSKTLVRNMKVHELPTMYKWDGKSYKTYPLTSDDQSALDGFEWNGTKPAWNQKKDMNLWQSRQWRGSGASRTFTFYGIVAPSEQTKVEMTFTVTYPDPLNPSSTLTKPYTATLELPNSKKVEFHPGFCTNININLNHKDEKMTVGAEYLSWQNEPAPNEGTLRKNSTFLTTTHRDSVTILGDEKATFDDATWLYVDTKDNNKIKDIYGNDGTPSKPFTIKTANELLSFAYEVKGTNRTSADVKREIVDAEGKKPGETGYTPTYEDLTISGAFDFKNYNVKLDADITLQATAESTGGVTWIGIGDAEHVFKGYFNGGFRHVRKLYGAPFFNTIGEDGIVDHIFFSDAIGIIGIGGVADKNDGIICGAYIEGDIESTSIDTEYSGSFVGLNKGVIIACSHIGKTTGNGGIVGALLGKNEGIVAMCYDSGDTYNNNPGGVAYAGIGAYSENSIAYCCYFNSDMYSHQDYGYEDARVGHIAFPLRTAEMQSNKFVSQLYDQNASNKGQITVPWTGNELGYHLSLNAGLKRFVEILKEAEEKETRNDGYITLPEISDSKMGPLRMKKSQVDWLITHYANDSHQFQFVPGTYPKLE